MKKEELRKKMRKVLENKRSARMNKGQKNSLFEKRCKESGIKKSDLDQLSKLPNDLILKMGLTKEQIKQIKMMKERLKNLE
jgi:hypothetical protein